MNRIYRRVSKSRKNQKQQGRNTPLNDNLHKVQTINGFSIIQLNEEEINLDSFSDLSNLQEKEITRIKKKAQAIEEYYLGKGKDSKINENCFNCLMNNFHENELLYFAKRSDLLTYLKYCFYFLKKILFLDTQIYTENKYDLDKCDDTNYLNGWKFFIPKTMCRGCFLQMINMEHLFGNLKTIFSDVDTTTLRRNFHRNRSHLNSRLRSENTIQKKDNGNNSNSQRKILGKSHKRMYFRYNLKNNKNISFDDKNGILMKKKILSEDVIDNLNDKKNKFLGKKKRPENNNPLGELLVTEIKIKSNEFSSEKGILKGMANIEKNNFNKNSKDIKTDASEKSHENNYILNNSKNSQNNKISINMKNISIIENNNNNFINKNPKEINNKLSINNEKTPTNILNEIMAKKGINNKIVMKLYIKLDTLIQWIYYVLADVFDFREKLNNTLESNPLIIANLEASNLDIYENNYRDIYNLLFKERKEFEEIFKKIKNDSIPNISRNLEKLKAQKNLKENEIKTLDDLKQTLNGYTNQINDLEKKYSSRIRNYFNDFNCLLTLIGEIKESLN